MYAKIRSVCNPIMVAISTVHAFDILLDSLPTKIANFVSFAKKLTLDSP